MARLAGAGTFGQIMLSIEPRGSARQSAIRSNLDFGTFSLKFSPLSVFLWQLLDILVIGRAARPRQTSVFRVDMCHTMQHHAFQYAHQRLVLSPRIAISHNTPMCSCVLAAGLGICIPQIRSKAFASGSWKCE